MNVIASCLLGNGGCQVEDALVARDQARALEIQSRRELARVLEIRKVCETPIPYDVESRLETLCVFFPVRLR